MREMMSTALRLIIITLVAGLCLGLTNAVTKEPIRQQELLTAEAMRKAVLEQADVFEDMQTASGGITAIYKGLTGADVAGYAYEISANGFGGEIKLTVGIADGSITGVRISSHGETPGLGAKATDEGFISQYDGKSGELSVIKAGTPDDTQILAITAATVTSQAVTNAVNEVLAHYSENYA